MLELTGVSRSYGDFKAVDNVSVSIGSGEIVGLLGHNGAGKTTVMKMLSGYLEPDSGTIRVGGSELQSNLKTIQAELGYLPENLPVYGEMTVVDYLDYAANLKRIPAGEKNNEIRRVVRETNLTDKINDSIATLSRGYKQRTGVAQAILGKPKLLILDEPTNGLDPSQTDQMRILLKTLSNSATVILSTHIMQEVEALCDRVLMMRSGQLVVDERLSSLQQSNKLYVQTKLSGSNIGELLTTIDGVAQIEPIQSDGATTNAFHLTLNSTTQSQDTAALVARTLISAGAELYELREQQTDIEALFREVNSMEFTGEEKHNAA